MASPLVVDKVLDIDASLEMCRKSQSFSAGDAIVLLRALPGCFVTRVPRETLGPIVFRGCCLAASLNVRILVDADFEKFTEEDDGCICRVFSARKISLAFEKGMFERSRVT